MALVVIGMGDEGQLDPVHAGAELGLEIGDVRGELADGAEMSVGASAELPDGLLVLGAVSKRLERASSAGKRAERAVNQRQGSLQSSKEGLNLGPTLSGPLLT